MFFLKIIRNHITLYTICGAIQFSTLNCKGMDIPLEELINQGERTPLINPQKKRVPPKEISGAPKKTTSSLCQYSCIDFSKSNDHPFFPFNQDVWLKIALKLKNIQDVLNLSLINKSIYETISENNMIKVKFDLSNISHQFFRFQKTYAPVLQGKSRTFIRPEKEEKDIQSMAELKRKQEKLLTLVQNQQTSPGIVNLYGAPYFDHIYETAQTIDGISNDMLPPLLDHSADQNPSLWSLCPSSKMSDDLTYLAGSVKYNVAARLMDLRRAVKIIGKNIPIVISGTTLFVGTFAVGAYLLHQQYPDGILEAFMAKNTTHYDWDPTYYLRYRKEDFFSAYCPPFSHYVDWGQGYTSFRACTGGGPMISGNITDWLNFMHDNSGCAIERLHDQLVAVMNTTEQLNGPMICLPRDNTTLCCLRAHQWNHNTSLSMDILIGNGLEAQEAATHNWKRNMGLYYGFVGPLSLTFIWMLLLSHFCL